MHSQAKSSKAVYFSARAAIIENVMRKLLFTIKAFFTAILVAACLIFVYALLHAPVFEQGERYEFYTGTSSDEIVLAGSSLEKLRLNGVKGESVRYQGDRAQELIERFHAEVLMIEEAAGVVNYYCYSSALDSCIQLNGKRVNLHIAVSKEATAAGTPIIFGGF